MAEPPQEALCEAALLGGGRGEVQAYSCDLSILRGGNVGGIAVVAVSVLMFFKGKKN